MTLTMTTTNGPPSSRRLNCADDTKSNHSSNNNDNDNDNDNSNSNSNCSNSHNNSPNLLERLDVDIDVDVDVDDKTIKKKRNREGRKKSRQRKRLVSASTSVTVIAIVCIYWYGFIWRTQHIMENFVQDRTLWQEMHTHLEPSPLIPEKFIYFQPIEAGQGAGNVISGLLAAHLFGEEFGRVVCVSKEYTDFLAAFEPTNAQAIRGCPKIPTNENGDPTVSFSLYNFGSIPNECALADLLNSSKPVLYFTGNTYPRWPKVPDDFFLKYYRPTKALLKMLPWEEPPHTVVHLRKGDNENNDIRKGLDDETLDALGQMLPHDTFLVANEVTWYHRFARKYSWRNSGWHSVEHSAFEKEEGGASHAVNNMQLWSDWYTILMAKQVLHTHSDFSISAIHWMNIKDTKTIMGIMYMGLPNGTTTKVLDLIDESWRRDGETIPLRDRNRVDFSFTDNDMRLCTAPLGFMATRTEYND